MLCELWMKQNKHQNDGCFSFCYILLVICLVVASNLVPVACNSDSLSVMGYAFVGFMSYQVRLSAEIMEMYQGYFMSFFQRRLSGREVEISMLS